MPVSELGYRHWEGRRTGVIRRSLAIARSEVGIAYRGSKLLRRFLVFAWAPVLYFCPFFLAIGYIADPNNELAAGSVLTEISREFFRDETVALLRANHEVLLPRIWSIAFFFFFAYTQSFFSMIVVAIAGPPLIARDIKSKAFLVYFSKPIRPWQYVLGKLLAVVFFVFSMTLFPAVVLYAIGVALSPDVGTLTATLPILGQVILSSVVIAVPIAMVVLLLSSLTRDRRIATFTWVGTWIFGEMAFRVLSFGHRSGGYEPPPWAALLSLRELTTRATASILELRDSIETVSMSLDGSGERFERFMGEVARELGEPALRDLPRSKQHLLNLVSSGYPAWVSIVVLVAISGVCGWFVMRRVARLVSV